MKASVSASPSPAASAGRSLCAAAAVAAALALALAVSPARAATIATWTGGGGNGTWSNGGNWTPAPPTTTGAFDLVFGGTAQALGTNPPIVTTTNDLGTVNIGTLQFINTGTLADGQAAFFRINGSTLALNSSTISTVAASGGSFITNSDGDTIAAPMTLAGTSSIITNNNHNLSLRGDISGAGGLIYDDGSVGTTEFAYVSGSNTYAGGTLIRGGFVQTGARVTSGTPAVASTSNNFAFGSGPVTVSDNGTLLLRNSSIISNQLTVSGSGSGLNPDNNSALVGSFGVVGQTAEYRGDITLAGPARFSTASSGTNDTTSKLLVTGNIDLGSNLLTLRSRRANVAGTLGMFIEITGTISGGGGVDVAGEGSWSRVLISGSNSYLGGTTITTGTLIVGSSSALGTGFLAVNTSGLDLNGQALQVGALSGSSSGAIRSNGGAATLITTSSTDSTYAGTILDGSGVVGLTKAGPGVLTLTGTNTYTGMTGVNGGVVALGSQGAIGSTGPVSFGGGTLRYSASNQVDYSARFASSAAAISIDTNGQNVTYATAIASTNVGGLTKTGSGTLFLDAANQYDGATTVNAGTLSGIGSVLGELSVAAGAVFDPGSGPSATTIFGVGSFSQAGGGITRMQVNGTTAGALHDQVLFSGTSKVVSWGGQLELALSGSYADYTEFDLFSGFTSQSGNLSGVSLSALGSPYDGLSFGGPDVNGLWKTGTNQFGQLLEFRQATGILTVVPEPTSLGLTAIGVASALGLGRWRRRRAA